jgi:amidase
MVPLAHGNDGGGSTRIPAACCGLVGLKASRGRVSMAPAAGEQFLSIDGVLTRTVRETALGLDLLAGPELGDASWAPPPAESFAGAAAREPKPLRVGLLLDPPLPDVPLDADYERATREVAALLEELGHTVEEVAPPFQDTAVMAPFTAVFGPMNCSLIAFASAMAGRPPTVDDIERLSLWLWETCQGISSVDGYMAMLQLQGVARQFVTWADPYDVVLTPSLAQPPLPIGTLDPDAPDPHETFRAAGRFTPFTAIANITGQPAISLPLSARDDGLPLGAHFFGRPADEATLLSLATQLESARPWADRRAPAP